MSEKMPNPEHGGDRVKIFKNLLDLVDSLTASSRADESLVIELRGSTQEDPAWPSRTENVLIYALEGKYDFFYHEVDYELMKVFLQAEQIDQAGQFIKQSLYDGKMNGSAESEQEFKTRIPGISMLVRKWEEWWQGMGGGHVGGTTVYWLVNHEPVKTFRDKVTR